jgi:cell division protein FtsX
MKNFKEALLILVSSPLLWIGALGASSSILAAYQLWSGHLQAIAKLADDLHMGFALVVFVFPFVFGVSACLAICGVVIGIGRLCRKQRRI